LSKLQNDYYKKQILKQGLEIVTGIEECVKDFDEDVSTVCLAVLINQLLETVSILGLVLNSKTAINAADKALLASDRDHVLVCSKS
jgi:hypothetical protein